MSLLKSLSEANLLELNHAANKALGITNDIQKISMEAYLQNPSVGVRIQDLQALSAGFLFLYSQVLDASGTVQKGKNHFTIN